MADAHYVLAISYYKLKNYDSAIRFYKSSEQLGAKTDPNLLKAIEEKK
jgi:hypothetical protein